MNILPHSKQHRLTDVVVDDTSGTCQLCGTVPLVYVNDRWRCSVKYSEEQETERQRYLRRPPLTEEQKARKREEYRNVYWARKIETTYNVSKGWYTETLEAQGGVCAICGRQPWDDRRFPVDHDHATGKVRGIICSPCNQLLGFARDDVDVLSSAIEYLRRFSC